MPIGFIVLALGLCVAIWFCDEPPVRWFLVFALLLNVSAVAMAVTNGDLGQFQRFEHWMGGADQGDHAD